MPGRVLYLIRHGEQDLEPTDDSLGSNLTFRGARQAQLLAARLGDLPLVAIHGSTLNRAAQTARIIGREFPHIDIQWSRTLWECIPSVPAHLVHVFASYETSALNQGTAQAESAFNRYFKRIQGDDQHEAIVCHGNLIRYFVCRVLRLPVEAWSKMDMNHCGLTEVHIVQEGQMTLVRHNDVGHLPLDMQTF